MMKCAFIFLDYTAAVKFAAEAVVDFDWTVNLLNDFSQRDIFCRTSNHITAADALIRFRQPSLRQTPQNFQSKPLWNTAVIRYLFGTGLFSPRRKTIHNADRIIRFMCDAHDLNVTGVENAFDSKGNLIGYVVKTATTGYNADVPIETATTITKDGKIVVGINILKQEETEYLGVRIQQDSFKNQFNGKKLPIADSSTVEKGSKVDIIAKSTISSKAVIDAVNNASEYVNTYLAE